MWYLAVLLLCFVSSVKAEVFSSACDLANLYRKEGALIQRLESHIRLEQQRIDALGDKLAYYKTKHAETVVRESLVNPLDAYFLIKRLSLEWGQVERLLNTTAPSNLTRLVGQLDFQGAAVALTRVHDTYGLNISEVSASFLLGTRYGPPLLADDCLLIGQEMKNYGDNYYAMVWYQEALRKCESKEKKLKILEAFHLVLAEENHETMAEAVMAELMTLDPKLEGKPQPNPQMSITEVMKSGFHRKKDANDGLSGVMRQNYNRLCKGDADKSPKRLASLKCRLVFRDSLLAPFKLEEVHKDPDIVIFLDAISNSEIAKIQQLTKPRMKRASVSDSFSGKPKPAEYRISKSAYLADKLNPVLAKISRRISRMTGLKMTYVEALQVVNYGLGGQYEPHNDYFVHLSKEKFGNRIATVMFYMSDVAIGGDTVFVELNVGVRPQKGSAIFWYNLHTSGEKDWRLRHAACPVVVGSKWVSNKWIHAMGQEFVRPCSLYQDGPKPSKTTGPKLQKPKNNGVK